MGRSALHRVVALVGYRSSTFDLAVAFEVFGRDPHAGVPWYRFTVAAPSLGPVQLDLGLDLVIKHDLSALRTADTVIVAGWSPPTLEVICELQRAQKRGVRMVSFCSGSLLLAAAGLLQGRRASTHWHLHDNVRELYPDIDFSTDVLFVDNGDVLTSAGSSAALDLALYIVRLDHGSRVANHVARNMVVAATRHGGQNQFVVAPTAADTSPDTIAATMDWIIAHLDEDLSLTTMAHHANLSVRQFSRRFQEVTGTAPHRWLIWRRIAHAQELLEQGNLSIEEVAQHSGFRTAAALRPQFQRQVSTSPSDYKRSFAPH